MKKRYIFYLIWLLIVGYFIYMFEKPSICGIPGCGDWDTTILRLLLLLIPVIELFFYFKKNKKTKNVLLIISILLIIFWACNEKINYINNQKTVDHYGKCSMAYKCICTKEEDMCSCYFCEGYDYKQKKCNSVDEKIQCSKYYAIQDGLYYEPGYNQ